MASEYEMWGWVQGYLTNPDFMQAESLLQHLAGTEGYRLADVRQSARDLWEKNENFKKHVSWAVESFVVPAEKRQRMKPEEKERLIGKFVRDRIDRIC